MCDRDFSGSWIMYSLATRLQILSGAGCLEEFSCIMLTVRMQLQISETPCNNSEECGACLYVRVSVLLQCLSCTALFLTSTSRESRAKKAACNSEHVLCCLS